MAFAHFTPLRLHRPTNSSISVARVTRRTVAIWEEKRKNPFPAIIPPPDEEIWKQIPGVQLAAPLELTLDDIMAIAKGESSDEYPNEIIRCLLGWRLNDDGTWDNSQVRPAWRDSYPDNPPDFIGDPNDYSREVDLPVKTAVQRLQRSISQEHKNLFRETLKPAGFPGWKVKDLTPNRTRRAVCTSYILFWYRVHYPDWVWQ